MYDLERYRFLQWKNGSIYLLSNWRILITQFPEGKIVTYLKKIWQKIERDNNYSFVSGYNLINIKETFIIQKYFLCGKREIETFSSDMGSCRFY